MNQEEKYPAIKRLFKKKKNDNKLGIEYYFNDKSNNWSEFLNEFNRLLEKIENNTKYSDLYNRFLNTKQNFTSDLLELKTLIYVLNNEGWDYEPHDNSPDFINRKLKEAFEVKASSLSMLCDFFYSKSVKLSYVFCLDKNLFLDILIKSKQNSLQEAFLNKKDIKNEFNKLFDSIKNFIQINKSKFKIDYKEENNDFILKVVENKSKSHPNINIKLLDFKQVLSSEEITNFNNFTTYEKQWINTLEKAIDKNIDNNFKLNIIMGTFRQDDLKSFIQSLRFNKFSKINTKKISKIYLVDLYEIRKKGIKYIEL